MLTEKQVAAKWFAVSDTLEEVDKAGRKSEIAYQTGWNIGPYYFAQAA